MTVASQQTQRSLSGSASRFIILVSILSLCLLLRGSPLGKGFDATVTHGDNVVITSQQIQVQVEKNSNSSSQYSIELHIPRNGTINRTILERGHLKKNSIILFFHIPKVGGSTIINNLKWVKHMELLQKMGLNWESGRARIQHYTSAPLPPSGRKTLFVHLHTHSPPFMGMSSQLKMWREKAQSNGVNFFAFTIMREPVSWAISLFNMYLRSNAKGNVTEVTDDDVKHVAQHNPQCSYLSHKFVQDDSTEAGERWKPTKEDCDNLLNAMRDQMDWVGRTEQLDDTTNLLSFLLDLPEDFEFHKFNSAEEESSGGKFRAKSLTLDKLDKETIEYHKNISMLDYQILDAADREWDITRIDG